MCRFHYHSLSATMLLQRISILLVLVFGRATTKAALNGGDHSEMLLLGNQDGPRQKGPYAVAWRDYKVETLDSSSQHLVLVFPRELLRRNKNEKFPLVAFMHGFLGGGLNTYIGHRALLRGVASFGFIVAAPRSCSRGCSSTTSSSLTFTTYYQETLKVIDWVEEQQEDHKVLQFVNRTAGYGLFGHSMGGIAAAEVLSAYAADFNIHAGALLHSVIASTVNVSTPTAFFTGTRDSCCGGETMKPMYDELEGVPKAFADIEGGRHTEPNLFRSRWPAYVAAWFHIFLSGEKDGFYYDLIYGSDLDSLCGGGIAMNGCDVLEPPV